jgi:uncharacterized protein (TIGR00645 family)
MARPPPRKPALERALEQWLFRARWLLAPIYLGLAVALAGLVAVFFWEEAHLFGEVGLLHPKLIVVATLSMIDLSLAANLVLLVIISGYQQFIARIEIEGEDDRLGWMGAVDFAGLKLKLVGSLVAISAVALLRAFVEITDGDSSLHSDELAWLIGIHLTFVVSGVLLALMDYIVSRTHRA